MRRLSYSPDLNWGPRPYQGRALPTELQQQTCPAFYPLNYYPNGADGTRTHTSGPERHVGVEPTNTCLEGRSLNRSADDALSF